MKTIHYTRCPVPTAFGLAIRLGWIAEEAEAHGFDLVSLQKTSDPRDLASHFTHHLPNSFRHGGNIPAIWAKSRGAETRVIGLSWTPQPHLILSLQGSGIETVSDLRGKRLAISRRRSEPDFWRASALRTYEIALETEGLSLSDVSLTEIDYRDDHVEQRAAAQAAALPFSAVAASTYGLWREEVFALARGEVDAIYAQSAFGVETAAILGAHTVYDASKDPDARRQTNNALPEVLSASEALIDEEPEFVARVLARVVEAGIWAASHPRETLRAVSAEQGLAEEIVLAAYGPALSESLKVDLCDFKSSALADRKRFLIRHGVITRDFDTDEWIDRRPLSRAREILASRAANRGSNVNPACSVSSFAVAATV